MTMGPKAMTPPAETHDLAAVPVMILAGGLGTRLRGVIGSTPKVLARVNGTPFLHYLLDQLVAAGTKHAVLCTGYQAGQVETCLGRSYRGLSLSYSEEPIPLGTAGALRHAVGKTSADPIMVLNGDSYCEVDLVSFWQSHLARRADASLVLTAMEGQARYGRVKMDEGGRITGFQEKPSSAASSWINAGIYLFARPILVAINEGPVSLEQEVLPSLVSRRFYGYPASGRFIDIGTAESFDSAQRFFQEPSGTRASL